MKVSETGLMKVEEELVSMSIHGFMPDRITAAKLMNLAAPAIISAAFEEAALAFNTMAKEENVEPGIARIVEDMFRRFGTVMMTEVITIET